MEQESLHSPDFTQPDLARTNLAQPDFVLPDPHLSVLQQAHQVSSWPIDASRPSGTRPDPALPDLLEPEMPGTLFYPLANRHTMPEPENAPEVVMSQRPGELDPAALDMLLDSPDEASLPVGLKFSQVYTGGDALSRRARRFALLEMGLQRDARDDEYAK